MDLFWNVALVVATVLLVTTAIIIAFGAPYLPTLKPQVDDAFELLDLKPGQTFLEIGSGDGHILKAAAQRGLHATGIEMNPFLVLISYLVTWRYRKRVKIIWGNAWKKDWPPADGVFVFLLQPFMARVDEKMTRQGKKGAKLISFTYTIPGKKVARARKGIRLYQY